MIHQSLYDHGGSRIYSEDENGTLDLIADTYTDSEYAKAVYAFTVKWMAEKDAKPDAWPVRCTWTLKGKVWELDCGSQWSYGGRPVHCQRCDRLTAEPGGQTAMVDAVASGLGVEPVITGADI